MTLFDAWQQCGNDQLMVREGRRCNFVARRDTFIETGYYASMVCGGDVLADDWMVIDGDRHE